MKKPQKLEMDICPTCKEGLNRATPAFGDHKLKPNDLSICFYCGSFNYYDDNLKLQTLTEEMYQNLPEKEQRDLQVARMNMKKIMPSN